MVDITAQFRTENSVHHLVMKESTNGRTQYTLTKTISFETLTVIPKEKRVTYEGDYAGLNSLGQLELRRHGSIVVVTSKVLSINSP